MLLTAYLSGTHHTGELSICIVGRAVPYPTSSWALSFYKVKQSTIVIGSKARYKLWMAIHTLESGWVSMVIIAGHEVACNQKE